MTRTELMRLIDQIEMQSRGLWASAFVMEFEGRGSDEIVENVVHNLEAGGGLQNSINELLYELDKAGLLDAARIAIESRPSEYMAASAIEKARRKGGTQ